MKLEDGEGFTLEWLYRAVEVELPDVVAIYGGLNGFNVHSIDMWRDGDRIAPLHLPFNDYLPIGIVAVALPRECAAGRPGAFLGLARLTPASTPPRVGPFTLRVYNTRTEAA